ncbi:MAG: helix-turn-helix transcriptional regulator [Candidatus Omnitrophota bacterium]|nr:MAG: helix-turn-helix transcriptional regulator [Candidatus Omnitrophota bacterium]
MVKDQKIIEQIKDYLKTHNLKQYELAQRLGIPPPTVTRWFKAGSIGNQSIQLLKREGVIK